MKLSSKSKRDDEPKVLSGPWGKVVVFTASVLWLVAVGVGLRILWSYENTPGVTARPPVFWPTDSPIQPDKDRLTLVMLVHPQCPCSRAAIGELALIMAQGQERLTANVLFLKPIPFSENWEKTDLWQKAASIPGVNVMVDEGGREALRFNAVTSGQTVLYDEKGRLQFSGGITSSRGHSGDNVGRSAIVSMVNGLTQDRAHSFVFGCPLFDENSECRKTEYESK
ncbi:MAG TPA: hypothetical protein VIT88_13485 [Pyrinomonadaceae bacterium]